MPFSKPKTEKSDDVTRARKRVADLHALRNHSETELRKKLGRDFIPTLIEKVVAEAKKRGWLPTNEAEQASLSEMIAEKLHRSRKGVNWINRKLEASGLPPVAENENFEIEKAMEHARKVRASRSARKNPAVKVLRSLQSKGFSEEVITRVLDNLNLGIPEGDQKFISSQEEF